MRIDADFECHRDRYGWTLTEWHDSVRRDTGAPVRAARRTYHATLPQLLLAALDRMAGRPEHATVADALRYIQRMEQQLLAVCQRAQRDG